MHPEEHLHARFKLLSGVGEKTLPGRSFNAWNLNPVNLIAKCLLASSEGGGGCTGVLGKRWFEPCGFHRGRWERSGLCLTPRMTCSSVLQEIPWQAVPAKGWDWPWQPKGRRAIERWGREHTATARRVAEHEVCFMSLCQNYLPTGRLSPDK